jgi:hypothetical protein
MSKLSTITSIALSLIVAMSATSEAFAYGPSAEWITSGDNQQDAVLPSHIALAIIPFTEAEKRTMKTDLPFAPELGTVRTMSHNYNSGDYLAGDRTNAPSRNITRPITDVNIRPASDYPMSPACVCS